MFPTVHETAEYLPGKRNTTQACKQDTAVVSSKCTHLGHQQTELKAEHTTPLGHCSLMKAVGSNSCKY